MTGAREQSRGLAGLSMRWSVGGRGLNGASVYGAVAEDSTATGGPLAHCPRRLASCGSSLCFGLRCWGCCERGCCARGCCARGSQRGTRLLGIHGICAPCGCRQGYFRLRGCRRGCRVSPWASDTHTRRSLAHVTEMVHTHSCCMLQLCKISWARLKPCHIVHSALIISAWC